MEKVNEDRILVTGGAGFIGSNLAEYLAKKKVKLVRILDNFSTGKQKNIDELLEKYDNIEFMYGDITDYETCKNAVKGIDMVSHQAALGSVPRSVDDPLTSNHNNVTGMLNMMYACKEAGIKRFVYASSSSVYGDDTTLPKKEDLTGEPLSPYAVTKCVNELYANVFTKIYGMECIGLRYFNVFGPRQDPNSVYAAVIPKFISLLKDNKVPTINGDGAYSRDFTYIDNVVHANCLALFNNSNRLEIFGEVYNVGVGGRVTIYELYKEICNTMNKTVEPHFGKYRRGDIPHSNASIDKIIESFGYKALVDFKDGIRKTVKYYMK